MICHVAYRLVEGAKTVFQTELGLVDCTVSYAQAEIEETTTNVLRRTSRACCAL